MKRHFLYACLLLWCLFCSCRKTQSPTAPSATVAVHTWNATKKIHSHAWFIDGKHVGGGSEAASYDRFTLTITRHPDSIGYVLQNTPTTSFSDTIRWDPANVPEMTSPVDGTLLIDGRTSIFKFQERAPDGRVVKTRELFVSESREDISEDPLTKLTTQIGDTFWSPPEKRLVRATIYQKGKIGSDWNSAKGQSDGKCGLRYATAKEAGTIAVPQWLPRGSMVKIHTEQGVYSYIAADKGTGVENRDAAKEAGKTEEEKAAPVLDFCAEKQLWPDLVVVEIYYYAGKVPFSELKNEDQKTLFAYAMEYVAKRE